MLSFKIKKLDNISIHKIVLNLNLVDITGLLKASFLIIFSKCNTMLQSAKIAL